MRLLLLSLTLSLTAAEPDWGKIIDAQNAHHHTPPVHHHETPEPATWILFGTGWVGLAVWNEKKGK